MAHYLTEKEVAEFNAKKDANGRVWNGEREYSVLEKEKVGDEIKYSLTTFKENATKDTMFFTEEQDDAYVKDYYAGSFQAAGSTESPYFAGGKYGGKATVFEKNNGEVFPIVRRRENFNEKEYIVTYDLLNGEELKIKYSEESYK